MLTPSKKEKVSLLFFFICLATAQPESRCSIHNQLSTSVYINNKPQTINSSIANLKSTDEFTVSFWFKPNDPTNSKPINIFTLHNSPVITKKKGLDTFLLKTNFPECPISPSLLKSHPSYKEDPHIKDNPNCFPENLAEVNKSRKIEPVDLVVKILEVSFINEKGDGRLIFDFPVGYDEGGTVIGYLTESLHGINFKDKSWLFAAATFDYSKGKGRVIVSNYNDEGKEHKADFKLELPRFSLKKGFGITYANNNGKEKNVYGYLYDLNMFYMYFEHLELLRFFNYDKYTCMLQNIRLELLFDAKSVDMPILATGEESGRFEVKGNVKLAKTGYIFTNKAHLPLKRLKPYPVDKLVNSIAFYFNLRLLSEVNDGYLLLTGKSKKTVLVLRLVRNDHEGSVFYALQATIAGLPAKYISPRFLEVNELSRFTFSVIQTDSRFISFYFSSGRRVFHNSKLHILPDFSLKDLEFSLFSEEGNKGQVLINRFVIMDDPLPSIISVQDNPLLESCNKNCEIPLDPHSVARSCLQCKNSVLFPVDNKCVEFCPPNTKNSSGVCVKCRENLCKEVFPTSLTLSRLNNTSFLLELDRRINELNNKKLENVFAVSINGLVKGKDYDLKMKAGSSKVILLNFSFKRSFYNKVLKVSTNFTDFEHVYDEDRNFIFGLDAHYKIPVVHHLSHQSEIITELLAHVIFFIFVATILIGFFLLALSFKYNLNDQIVKKFSVLFRDKQLLPLLLFLHIIYPSNLHNFLSILYSHVIGFNAVIAPFTDDIYLIGSEIPHPNFFDRQLTSLFLQNFGVIFILHCVILTLFILTTLFRLCYDCLSMRLKEFLLKIRDSFEYNLIIISFVVFDFQIFVFANLDFQKPVLTNSFTYASFYIAVAYVSFFFFFIIAFTIAHKRNESFVPQSDLKFKLSFMFIGYRNKPLSNYYEIIIMIMNFATSAILVFLRSKPIPQVTTFIGLMVIYLAFTLIIKPYEENEEGKLESFNKILLVCMLIFIAALAIDDINQSYNSEFREIVGWIIITLINLYIIVNFILAVVDLVKFVLRIRKSSKLIFYDKEEGFSSIRGKTVYREDIDMEEKNVESNLGKFGNLGDEMEESYFFTEKRGSEENMVRVGINESQNSSGSDYRRYRSFQSSSFEKENEEKYYSGKR